MVGHARAISQVLVVGANHRTTSLAFRDRLYVDEMAMQHVLRALHGVGVGQALVVSTCDRIEVAAVDQDPERAATAIGRALAAHAGMSVDELDGQLFVRHGEAALRHLFGVAASLESVIVGEPHVLGQVKDGHAAARRAGMVGGELETVMQGAYASAKRVRTETAIGRRPVSIASAAVELALDLHGDLGRCRGLLIGTGEMGELIAEALRTAGLSELSVSHPVPERAERLARALDCHEAPFAALDDALAAADVVVCALGTRQAVIDADRVRLALRARRNRPVFLVDAAFPGDVDAAIEKIDSAFRYTLEDLERIALESRSRREEEATDAWRIVDEELEAFMVGSAERAAAPVLNALRRRFEDTRAQALADAGGDAEKATRLLVSRLLHDPSRFLRSLAANGKSGEMTSIGSALQRVFSLPSDDTKESRRER